MLTIIQAADFHLDAPFDALTPQQAAERRGEQRELLDHLVRLQQEHCADLVLLPGDLFDRGDAAYETGEALLRTLSSMAVPVFIAPGNHDFCGGRSPYRTLQWPKNVRIFTDEAMESVSLETCTVCGCAFTSPYRESDPLRGFMAPKDEKPQIGVLHGDVGGKGRYGPIEEASIAVSGLTYLALGHVHSFAGLQKTGETCWAYSGCLEGRGFDETGEKGALVVTIEGEKVAAKFCPLPARRYEILPVDVTDRDPKQALLQALPQDRQRDCYRILLTGESGEEGIDLAPLRALAEPLFYSVTIQDRTRVRQDVWKRCGEETLTGGFLREMKRRIERCEERDGVSLDRALRFGLAALEHREVPQ